jgi:hypothetical protein
MPPVGVEPTISVGERPLTHYVNIAYAEFSTNRSINMENASRNLFVP